MPFPDTLYTNTTSLVGRALNIMSIKLIGSLCVSTSLFTNVVSHIAIFIINDRLLVTTGLWPYLSFTYLK